MPRAVGRIQRPHICVNSDGQYRNVNRAFATGVGRNQIDIIGNKIWDVFPKEEADKRFAVVKWVFEKIIEVWVPRPDAKLKNLLQSDTSYAW